MSLHGGVLCRRRGMIILLLEQLVEVDGLRFPGCPVEEGSDGPAVGGLRPVHRVPEQVLVTVGAQVCVHRALHLTVEPAAATARRLHLTQPC